MMDAGGLIARVLGLVLRRGLTQAARRAAQPAPGQRPTPEQRQQAQAARETAKRAQQALRLARRFGRF